MKAIQAAAFAVLSGDATLRTLARNEIWDAVPGGTRPTYVAIGEWTEVPFRTFGGDGHETTFDVESFSDDQDAEAGFAPVFDLNNRVVELLDGASLAVEGHATVLCLLESSEAKRAGDEPVREVLSTFRVIVEDNAP